MTWAPSVTTDIRKECPCGKAPELMEHAFGEGILNGDGQPARITRRFVAPVYFHEATGRGFCSVRCSIRWMKEFFWRYQEHMRRRA